MKKQILESKINLLKILKKISDDDRKVIIKYLSSDGIDVIGEAVYNCLYNKNQNKQIRTKGQRKKILSQLKNKEKIFSYIARKSNSNKKRRKLTIQEGGGIGLILATAIPFLANLIFGKK